MCEKLPETLKSGYFKGSRLSFVGCPLQVTQKRTRPLFIVLRPGRLQREASQSFSQPDFCLSTSLLPAPRTEPE